MTARIPTPRTREGRGLLAHVKEWGVENAFASVPMLQHCVLAIEAEAWAGEGLDVDRLAQAIQSTILTSPGEYTGPGMGAYRTAWRDLTLDARRHVLGDAKALATEYARLSQPDPEPPEEPGPEPSLTKDADKESPEWLTSLRKAAAPPDRPFDPVSGHGESGE